MSGDGGDEGQQMTFEEVCEMETIPGSPGYAAWIAAGRPAIEVNADGDARLRKPGSRADRLIAALMGNSSLKIGWDAWNALDQSGNLGRPIENVTDRTNAL